MAQTKPRVYNSKRRASDQEIISYLQLIRSENIGPATFNGLLEVFGCVDAAIDAVPEISAQKGKRGLKLRARQEAEAELENTRKYGADIILVNEPIYPKALANIFDAPPTLTVLGDIELLDGPSIGIVGARNASLGGKKMAELLSTGLSKHDIVVTSGLARGIDTCAHKGALEKGTIAVVAGGIDYIYPPENTTLYNQIKEKGAIVTEVAFGVSPIAQHFPKRNRIISGLSKGVVVIEAAAKSGSLITAKFALEQDRDIYVVPGSPLDPRCRGSNNLIRQGATLIQTVEDIIQSHEHVFMHSQLSESVEEYKPEHFSYDAKSTAELSDVILQHLSDVAIELDEIARLCKTNVQQILCSVIELELIGKANRCPGNKVVRVYSGNET